MKNMSRPGASLPAGFLCRSWVARLGVARATEPALAASEGRMPKAKLASSERRPWMAVANVRRCGTGNPDRMSGGEPIFGPL